MLRAGTADVFVQPELIGSLQVIAGQVVPLPVEGEIESARLVSMINGITSGSLFAQIMPLLTPQTAEAVVEIAAEGVVAMTAQLVKEPLDCGGPTTPTDGGGPTTTGSSGLQRAPATDLITQRLRYAAIVTESIASTGVPPSGNEQGGSGQPQNLLWGICCVPYQFTYPIYSAVTGCGPGTMIVGNAGGCKRSCSSCKQTNVTYGQTLGCAELVYTTAVPGTVPYSQTYPLNSGGGCD